MFHLELKNEIIGKVGDLLLIHDDGRCSISSSLPVNGQRQQAPIAVECAEFPDADTRAKRHAYTAKRKLKIRSAEQIEIDRDRILGEAVKLGTPFYPADIIKAFYSGYVKATDRRATNVRDDLRLMAKAGLLDRVSDSPLLYCAAKGKLR